MIVYINPLSFRSWNKHRFILVLKSISISCHQLHLRHFWHFDNKICIWRTKMIHRWSSFWYCVNSGVHFIHYWIWLKSQMFKGEANWRLHRWWSASLMRVHYFYTFFRLAAQDSIGPKKFLLLCRENCYVISVCPIELLECLNGAWNFLKQSSSHPKEYMTSQSFYLNIPTFYGKKGDKISA